MTSTEFLQGPSTVYKHFDHCMIRIYIYPAQQSERQVLELGFVIRIALIATDATLTLHLGVLGERLALRRSNTYT
jgi:hypothetical protein